MLVAEMALYYKRKGMTLIDAFKQLCRRFGYFKEDLMNFSYEGADGAEKMRSIIGNLRKNPPSFFAGSKVIGITDYHKERLREGEFNSETGLPDSNVLEYRTENGCKVIVRPSGTEPKMKAYLSASGKTEEEASSRLNALKNDIPSLGL